MPSGVDVSRRAVMAPTTVDAYDVHEELTVESMAVTPDAADAST